MASFKAKFVQLTETKKTALCALRAPFSNRAELAYLNADDVRDVLGKEPEPRDEFSLPDGLVLVDLIVWDKEEEREKIATTKDGVVLKTVAFA